MRLQRKISGPSAFAKAPNQTPIAMMDMELSGACVFVAKMVIRRDVATQLTPGVESRTSLKLRLAGVHMLHLSILLMSGSVTFTILLWSATCLSGLGLFGLLIMATDRVTCIIGAKAILTSSPRTSPCFFGGQSRGPKLSRLLCH